MTLYLTFSLIFDVIFDILLNIWRYIWHSPSYLTLYLTFSLIFDVIFYILLNKLFDVIFDILLNIWHYIPHHIFPFLSQYFIQFNILNGMNSALIEFYSKFSTYGASVWPPPRPDQLDQKLDRWNEVPEVCPAGTWRWHHDPCLSELSARNGHRTGKIIYTFINLWILGWEHLIIHSTKKISFRLTLFYMTQEVFHLICSFKK